MADRTRTMDGIVYAVNPAVRPNPAELVVIENPAQPSGRRPRAGADKRRASAKKQKRDAQGRFIKPRTNPSRKPMATPKKKTTRSTRSRRKNPAAGALKNAPSIYLRGGALVGSTALSQIIVTMVNAQLQMLPALAKGFIAVALPGMAGVAIVNKATNDIVEAAGYGAIAVSAANAFQLVRGAVSSTAGGGVQSRPMVRPQPMREQLAPPRQTYPVRVERPSTAVMEMAV